MAASVSRQETGLKADPGAGVHARGSTVNSGPAGVMTMSDGCAPDGVMTTSDSTQAPGSLKDPVSWMSAIPVPTLVLTCPCWVLKGVVTWAGGGRGGRMKFGIRTCIATNATSVTAIA